MGRRRRNRRHRPVKAPRSRRLVVEQFEARCLLALTASGDSNAAPVTNSDYVWIDQTPFALAAPGVLGNDSDADGDKLSAILVSQPLHGELTLNADGGFTYLPLNGYLGDDEFIYKSNDGKLDGTDNFVKLTVALTPAPRIQAAADNFVAAQGLALEGELIQNDLDPQGLPLYASFSTFHFVLQCLARRKALSRHGVSQRQ